MIDNKKFFEKYKQQFGPFSTEQFNGLQRLIEYINTDKHITDSRWVAYILATIYHECARTWQPIKEKGHREYFIKRYGSQTKVGKSLGNDTPEEGAIYHGRAYVQTTGESNYEMAEKVLRSEYPEVVERFEKRTGKKFDLTAGDQPNDMADPDNLLDAEIAYYAMSVSVRKGLYTGVGLGRFINGAKCDFINARKVINGLDCAAAVADYAAKFLTCLQD